MFKNRFSRNLLLRLIILVLFTSLFINCSEDDDSENTFLERFDNTTWVSSDDDGVGNLYIKIHDNIASPLEFWMRIELDCFYRYTWSPEEELELIENSRNTLIYKYIGSNDSVTYTVEGETIKYIYSSSTMDSFNFETTLYETSNSMTDGLNICD